MYNVHGPKPHLAREWLIWSVILTLGKKWKWVTNCPRYLFYLRHLLYHKMFFYRLKSFEKSKKGGLGQLTGFAAKSRLYVALVWFCPIPFVSLWMTTRYTNFYAMAVSRCGIFTVQEPGACPGVLRVPPAPGEPPLHHQKLGQNLAQLSARPRGLGHHHPPLLTQVEVWASVPAPWPQHVWKYIYV